MVNLEGRLPHNKTGGALGVGNKSTPLLVLLGFVCVEPVCTVLCVCMCAPFVFVCLRIPVSLATSVSPFSFTSFLCSCCRLSLGHRPCAV